jgi:transcriptional regulator with XRE-family HTH domain
MGKSPSYKPSRLGAKIVSIRRELRLSQNGLIRHLGLADELFQGDISAFELGNRVPDLRTLLLLAQAKVFKLRPYGKGIGFPQVLITG